MEKWARGKRTPKRGRLLEGRKIRESDRHGVERAVILKGGKKELLYEKINLFVYQKRVPALS